MIDWKEHVRSYEDASHRLRTARVVLFEASSRLTFIKGEKKIAAVDQIKKARKDITKAKSDLLHLGNIITRAIREEIQHD